LKEIADLCGITENLTFHLARHTFATTVALTNGAPIETVSKMLGQNRIRTTQTCRAKSNGDVKILKGKLDERETFINIADTAT